MTNPAAARFPSLMKSIILGSPSSLDFSCLLPPPFLADLFDFLAAAASLSHALCVLPAVLLSSEPCSVTQLGWSSSSSKGRT